MGPHPTRLQQAILKQLANRNTPAPTWVLSSSVAILHRMADRGWIANEGYRHDPGGYFWSLKPDGLATLRAVEAERKENDGAA